MVIVELCWKFVGSLLTVAVFCLVSISSLLLSRVVEVITTITRLSYTTQISSPVISPTLIELLLSKPIPSDHQEIDELRYIEAAPSPLPSPDHHTITTNEIFVLSFIHLYRSMICVKRLANFTATNPTIAGKQPMGGLNVGACKTLNKQYSCPRANYGPYAELISRCYLNNVRSR